ncbi:Alpha-amylase precursor [Candidatus Izimaplasma bacterium HR1]|jgi:glycosidase|uniref:alpha-amylase family glycosyl hydrolase n=1 Tax=Candidatus Izimoplasma sp. HR1 TaxID=1541959 RepID=UPI0004F6A3D8|nr:Alpha-amylase precursor [Candidatus Izimaplasma bacterium HR1]
MKKYILGIILILVVALSGCRSGVNTDVTFSIDSDTVVSQFEGENFVKLYDVSASDYLGKDISAFIEVRGTYDLDVPGNYNISLYVADDYGNNGEINIVLEVKEITCEIDDTQEKCIIHIESINFSEVTNNITGLYLDDFVKITVEVTPQNADNRTIIFSSSDETVATVSEYGFVFAHKVGTVTITAKSEDGSFEITKEISVWEKTCDVDPLQDKCAADILDDQSRIVTLGSSNVSGTNYNEVYVNNRVYYQIYVRTFADSDGNYKGDINGIIDNLQYLKDLGVGGIWLMPVTESRSDHGYEVDDYFDIDSEYGTMSDFEDLLVAADLLDIDIIIDLVINHMGAYNEIFQDVLRNGTNSDYYNWFSWLDSDDPKASYKGSWGQTIWYAPEGREWLKDGFFDIHPSLYDKVYCGYFSDWMPDLNLENPEVRQYLEDVGEFWLNKGVAGFRMDATSHFYANNEHFGLNNHEENVAYLTEYFSFLETVNPEVFVVAEAWEGYGTYASYNASGVSTINFESNYKIKDAVNGNYINFAESINAVYNEYSKYNPDFIDAPFISHHDGLGRIASHTGGFEETRLAAEVLLTLTGNPIIYYGDEVGMKGVSNTRNNMIWGSYYSGLFAASIDINTDTVDEQLLDPDSLLSVYTNIANVRNDSLALSYGDFTPYQDGYLEGYYRAFENGEDKEVVVVLFNFTNTFFIPIPDEFTSYEIMYRTNDSNFGGISPNSTMIIKIPWDLYESLN